MRSSLKRQIKALAGKIEKMADVLDCDGAIHDYAFEILSNEEEWFDGLSENKQEAKYEEYDEATSAIRLLTDRMEEIAYEIRQLSEEAAALAETD